ncbi:MAG: hypothetical protein P1R58_12860 [bacterium]|nr:hypothetical protein [bacterium]
MKLVVQNSGRLGVSPYDNAAGLRDCLTGDRLYMGSEYPSGSGIDHLYRICLWFGGIQGEDTLVSTGENRWHRSLGGEEFRPLGGVRGSITKRSTLDTNSAESGMAVSEEDFVTAYTDTIARHSNDFPFGYYARPLDIEVSQESYAWSIGYAADMVLLKFVIKNSGFRSIKEAYIGLYCKSQVSLGLYGGGSDDLSGLMRTYSSFYGCGFEDSLYSLWFIDNDGDPFNGEFIDRVIWDGDIPRKSAFSAIGMRFLDHVSEDNQLSYNRWHYYADFGPRMKNNLRDFGTGTIGYPEGDRNRYFIMSNGEIDYDDVFTASIGPWDPVWEYPSDRSEAISISQGHYPEAVLSVGPFDLHSGAELSIPVAIFGGQNVHVDPASAEQNLPDHPLKYYENLDFSDLARNAMWAEWIYDNPGFDTDGDGYRGKYRVCVHDSILDGNEWIATKADTQWYEGDGIPDWRAATPPHPPPFWVTPVSNGLHIRFNGAATENERDALTQIKDFEGYNVWIARDDRKESYSLVASYDIKNYDKYRWSEQVGSNGEFVLDDLPMTLEQIRCLYASGPEPCHNAAFNPHNYTGSSPYHHPSFPESTFYFTSHHYNAGLGKENGISKIYPKATLPPPGADTTDDRYYTKEGYLKYYEYEFTIENLLPTVDYYVSVSAFDFGSPKQGLQPLESDKTENAVNTFPLSSDDQVGSASLMAYVYPNPYRIDSDYRDRGYEGRTQQMLPNDKVRSVHFANLPARCWIRIYSIDGDLIRELRHERDDHDPNRLHDRWDLINRNRQIVVSGLYYWVVESDDGDTQMGKLAIIF